MPIVFEEMTGEVEPRRGDPAAESRGSASEGPPDEQVCQMVAAHLQRMTERCLRSFTD
jgi:hypothetical protein